MVSKGNQDDEMQEARGWGFYRKRLAVGIAVAIISAFINYLFLEKPVIYWFILGLLVAFVIILEWLHFRNSLDQKIRELAKAKEIEVPSAEAINEVVYTFYSKLLGLAYEDLAIDGVVDGGDGSMTIRRRSTIVSHSLSGIGAIPHCLLAEAREGEINVIDVKGDSPFKTLTWDAQKTTADRLTLIISIKPPLTRGQILDLEVIEKTPPGSITRTKKEMDDKIARGEKEYPYECFFWDIRSPIKHLKMRVLIPENLKPVSPKVAAWYEPSRLPHEQECERIQGWFHEELIGDQYVLSLEVAYPIPGLRYTIMFVPPEIWERR